MLKAGILVLAMFAFASCAQDDFLSGLSKKGGSEVSISVSMNETKTVNDGIHTCWNTDDAISLLTYPLDGTGYYNYRFTYYSDESGNRFRGRIEDYGEINTYYAFYPYDEKIKSPKNFTISINKVPVQTGNNSTAHLAGENFPLYGKQLKVKWGDPISISMGNILSVARFNVTNATESPIVVKSIEFTSSNYITGKFSSDITVDDPIWNSEDGASTKVVLTVNEGDEIAAGSNAEFFAGILPNTCSAGSKLKVKITATVGSDEVVFYRLIELNSATTFLSGYRKKIECPFDTEHSEDPWPESEEQKPAESEKYYYKVTTTPASWEGTYLIVDEDNGVAFAENRDSYKTPVEIFDGKIETKPALVDHQVTVTTSDAGSGKFDIKTILKQYLYSYSGGILFESNVSNNNTYYNTLSISGGKVVISSSYGQSQKRFCYTGGKFDYINDENAVWSTAGVALYRLGNSQGGDPVEDPDKESQTISFSSETYNWTLGSNYSIGSSYSIPTLSGAKTDVTYSSSNTNVATIESGKIYILSAGTTVIKATAAETDTYNGAVAQFTLNIKSSGESSESYYVKVTSEPTSWDGTYLVVDESAGKAFAPFTDNASSYSVSVTISGGQIASNSNIDKYAITVSGTGKNHENSNVSSLKAYNVKNSDGKYIWWTSNFGDYDTAKLVANSTNTATNSSTEYTYYHTFKYDGGVQMVSAINDDGGSAYYLAYSSNAFAYEKSETGNRVQLYKLNGTVTPDTPDEPDEPQTGDYFVKVSSAPSSWTGTYLVVDESAGKAFAYNSSSSYATTVSISSGKIAWTSSLDDIALRVSDAGLDHPNTQMAEDISYSGTLRAYNVKNKAGKYIYSSQSEIQVSDSNESSSSSSNGTAYYHAFCYSGGGVYMFSSKDYTSSTYQKYYYTLAYSSSKFAYGQGESELAKVQLYKLNGEGGGSTEPEEEDDPTPSGTSFNLENSTLTKYLDDVATSYTNSNYSTTVVKSYTGTSATLDVPNPVSLTWTGNATSIDIYEGTSTTGTPVKTMSFSSSTSVDIYNLIPGKNYSYKTSNGQTGTFNTTGRRRMIKVSDTASANHARNCRDLGGIVTAKGEKLNYGLIFRGTNMDEVTTSEKTILRDELGIKLDVDLRGGSSSSGYSWGGQSGKSESPLGSDIAISNQAYTAGSMTSADSKLKITIPDIINSVIDGKPVYIHCYIGSDRTGYVCMLIEALLGVSKKECDIDYEITSFASKIVSGVRPKEYTDNQDFREKFTQSPYDADSVPEAVEDYVVNTLGVSLTKVKAFRKAMGVSETL